MTGAQHYREAERLLAEVEDRLDEDTDAELGIVIARAQVHATLAHVGLEVDLAIHTPHGGQLTEPADGAWRAAVSR